ncbi:MAG TPA: hypothetical protein VJB82_00220 [Candidatus Peribacterales bacterium]|nr:hypothetical protein [Candidatus Peribacterales bacterium]
MRIRLGSLLVLCLFCGFLSQNAEAQSIPADQTKILFIENVGLPSVRSIIRSLETQNAPVPSELTAIAESAGDPDAFYALASSYFGTGWQERISRDASSLMDPEAAAMVRVRIYLASLGSNAERIARTSTVDANEIRKSAQNLMRQSQYIRSDDERKEFYAAFANAQEKIFPEESGPDLSDFRMEVTALLQEIVDAIDILVDGMNGTSLKKDQSALEQQLAIITGNQELTAWLARFDTFAGKLLSYATAANTSMILADAHSLLVQLHTYLTQLEGQGIDSQGFMEESAALLTTSAEKLSPASFETFITGLEDLLTRISQQFPSS